MALDIANMITTTAADSMTIRYGNTQDQFKADTFFPPLYCDKEKTKIYQADTNNFRAASDESDSKSEANKVEHGYFSTDKTLTLKKLAGDIDPNDEAQVDKPVSDIETEQRMTIMDKLLIGKEIRAAAKATDSTKYPSDLYESLGASSTWDVSGGDPKAVSKRARLAVKARCGMQANAMWISTKGLEALKQNEALRDEKKYTMKESLTVEILKNMLELSFIFECSAMKNTNLEGNATQTLSEIWGNFVIFGVYDPAPRLKKICSGVQPIFKQFYSHQYIDDKRGGPAGRVRVIELGWSYSLESAAVVSSSDSSFAAAYLVANPYT